ncbi:MAG: GTPase HflX [Clostridiales bacterium]|nr:GTPase HflX [Clostridiales bacterium]
MNERVLIVGVNAGNNPEFKNSMEELRNLAEACNYTVVSQVEQNMRNKHSVTYVGSGKIMEIKLDAEAVNAEKVIFNDELSPSQLRNLENALNMPVFDRTALILEIFGKRARTREAKLQVEMAQVQYLLPRLIGSYSALGRQSGGVGTKNKGVGEKKLELDRRRAEQKIVELEKALQSIQNERTTQRKRRVSSELPSIALVGYTNSGKSTLLNAFVSENNGSSEKFVLEKNMLFATLETSVRQIIMKNKRRFLLSDTVGFVSNLPHGLIKAFRSTLEEVIHADLLLHVVDYSNPNYEEQMKVTLETLKEIGADQIPVINVFNKSELVLDELPNVDERGVYISARERIGIDILEKMISDQVFTDYVECTMRIPFTEGALVSYLNDNACVKEMRYENDGTILNIECRAQDFQKYQKYIEMN